MEDALADNEGLAASVNNITLMPPVNACDVVIDKDSGEEDSMLIDNLPEPQLQAPAEINVSDDIICSYSSDFQSKLPLSEMKNKLKNKYVKNKKKNKKIKHIIG